MTLDKWIPFFEYLTSASAAILAFTFAVFQIRGAEHWRRDPLRQLAAITTLTELSAPVFFGLIFMMTYHTLHAAGRVVGGIGYVVMSVHIVQYWRCRRNRNPAPDGFDKWQLAGLGVTFVTFSGLFWWPNLSLKAGVCIWMIFSGFSEAWLFLGAGRRKADQAGQPGSAAGIRG